MAEYYRVFDAVSSDRQYTSQDFADIFQRFLRNGVIPDVGNELVVAASSPVAMSVTVNTGEAMINGRWYKNSALKTVNISAADPTNPRIDRIILKLDLNTGARSIIAQAKTGTPAASPSPPSLQQDATIWEISLAQVLVGAGVTTITADKITSERANDAVCGWAMPQSFPTGAAQGDIYYESDTGPARLAAGSNGQVLTTHGTGANPTWETPSGGGGTGVGGTTLNCQATNIPNGSEVRFGRITVPTGKTMTIVEAGVYPSGVSNMIVEVYNNTNSTTVYSTNSSIVQGTSLATVAEGKDVVFRLKNTSGTERTGCVGFVKFSVA